MKLKILIVLLSSLFTTAALAAMSCSSWMDQGDGTSWATCVDDRGVQHCYVISNKPGSVAQEVSC